MPHYQYLIIGGGMTADAAVRGIRDVDREGSIGLIGAELDPPYNRPPLSKGLWKGRPVEKIWRGTEKFGVELHLGRMALVLHRLDKRVTDDEGTGYTFDKLLLATGGNPNRFPFGEEEIIYFRTFRDYQRLHRLSVDGRRFAVIGSGFIGSEIAAALTMTGNQVTLIFPEDGIGARLFPADLAAHVTRYYREKGVEVLTGHTVADVRRRGEQTVVTVVNLADETRAEIAVDGVVAGLGIHPNVQLAQVGGLEVDDGIVVDEQLRTSRPDVYAAGDVAAFYSPVLRQRMRMEHEDNANTSGRMAGRAMAGQPQFYNHLPFLYSDLFELGYEAVGQIDPSLETVAVWREPNEEGIIYYLRDDRVRGVLLWNVWEQVEAARQLIAEAGPFTPDELKSRLPL